MKPLTFPQLANLTEDQAREYIEKTRWINGIFCPHCNSEGAYKLKPVKNGNRPLKKGVYKCKNKDCRKLFTVTVGTIFEGSHVSLKKWLMAICLVCSSKKGISAHQLHRMLGITYKSAWFLAHRIRFGMQEEIESAEKLSGVIEADETYVGGKGKGKRGRGSVKKTPVFTLVERNGRVRSTVVDRVTARNLKSILRENVEKDAVIMTDEFRSYWGLSKEFKEHNVVEHGRREYARGNIHVNTAEGFFGVLKRGINGVYQHVSKEHLRNYLHEFDFRFNLRHTSDNIRTVNAIKGFEGKRLMYRDSSN